MLERYRASRCATALFVPASYDGVTAATPLDLFRQNAGMLFDDLMTAKAELSGPIAGIGWDLVNLRIPSRWYLVASSANFYLACARWDAGALSICALLGFDEGSSTGGGSVMFHLFSGATMFGAFFIITDPVSSAVSNRGRHIRCRCWHIGVSDSCERKLP